jgi:hypothetical protein
MYRYMKPNQMTAKERKPRTQYEPSAQVDSVVRGPVSRPSNMGVCRSLARMAPWGRLPASQRSNGLLVCNTMKMETIILLFSFSFLPVPGIHLRDRRFDLAPKMTMVMQTQW